MKVLKIISEVCLFLFLIAVIGLAVGKFTHRLPFSLFVVSSGSMEPALPLGSLILVSPQSSYSIGDIITFSSSSRTTTTHRIVASDGQSLRTAGDANPQPDISLITPDRIVGKVMYHLPYLGYLGSFAKTPPGFIFLIIIPATIIVYEELKLVYRATFARLPRPSSSHFLYLFAIILPLTGLALFYASFTRSVFSDLTTSTGNLLTAWVASPSISPTAILSPTPLVPTPTPSSSPLHLVINEISPVGDADLEWVELYNPTASPVDLTGWTISDNTSSDSLPALTLAPGQYAVIVASSTQVSVPASALTLSLSTATIGNGLAANDRVVLTNSQSVIVDSVSFGTDTGASPQLGGAPASGETLARTPDAADTDLASDWNIHALPTLGTPNP